MNWQEKFQKLSSIKIINDKLWFSIMWSDFTKCWYVSNNPTIDLFVEMDGGIVTFACHEKAIEDAVNKYWDIFTTHEVTVEWRNPSSKKTHHMGEINYINNEFFVTRRGK